MTITSNIIRYRFTLTLILAIGLLGALLIGSPQQAWGQPRLSKQVSGVIQGDVTWTKAESPYILTGRTTIPNGSSLTIEPGVVVQGQTGTELKVFGTLTAVGTVTETITFTSESDSGPDQWSGLVFDGGTGELRHTTVRYAGNVNSLDLRSNITVRNSASVQIDHSVITQEEHRGTITLDVTDYGMYIENSTVHITNSSFIENGNSAEDVAVYTTGDRMMLTMQNNIFSNNSVNRVVIDSEQWKPSSTITLEPQEGLEGYQINQFFTITDNITMTIAPGTTVMGRSVGGIKVQGNLTAIGTATQPITFTKAQSSSGWRGLLFDGSEGKGSGTLKYVSVWHGGQPNGTQPSNVAVVDVQAPASVHIEQGDIRYAYAPGGIPKGTPEQGIYVENSVVSVDSTYFQDNGSLNNDNTIYVTGNDTELSLTRSEIVNNSESKSNESGPRGVLISGGKVNVWCTSFAINKGSGAIYTTRSISTTVTHSSFINNQYGVIHREGPAVFAKYNWWNSASGPYTGTPGINDPVNAVSGNVLYDPWLTSTPDCLLAVYLPLVQR